MVLTIQSNQKDISWTSASKAEQGHQTAGLEVELRLLPDSQASLFAFAERLLDCPCDWPGLMSTQMSLTKLELPAASTARWTRTEKSIWMTALAV